MNAPTLRGLAVLALLVLVPCARAVSIVFNPATTNTYLDITFDYTTGGNSGTAAAPGWTVAFNYAPDRDRFYALTLTSTFGVTPDPAFPLRAWYMIDYHSADEFYQWWFVFQPGPRPTGYTKRVTWDVSSYVPDAGGTGFMLAAALVMLGLVSRKRSPRV